MRERGTMLGQSPGRVRHSRGRETQHTQNECAAGPGCWYCAYLSSSILSRVTGAGMSLVKMSCNKYQTHNKCTTRQIGAPPPPNIQT